MDVGTACRMQGIGLKTSHLAESAVSTNFKRHHIASEFREQIKESAVR